MAATRILLIGRGHLGGFLRERLGVPDELHWTDDLSALDAARLKRLAPAAVVNAAGKTDLRWCEENSRECFRCNVAAPVELFHRARAALGGKAIFVQLSSGCVWDGPYKEDGAPFGPGDPARPACFYSWTKSACDALLRQESAGAPLVILRPRQVYSPLNSPRNTLHKLRAYPKLIDTPNSMTSAETIARTIERSLAEPKAHGRVLCVYERGVTSPYEVGTFLAQAGLRAAPERISKADLDTTLKPKRVDTVLHDPFFEKLVDPPKVQDELKRVIAAYGQAAERA